MRTVCAWQPSSAAISLGVLFSSFILPPMRNAAVELEEWRQSSPVFRFHGSFPFVLSWHLLQHQRIDEGEADLDQMQG
jgi:hypothetical protein